MPKNYPQEIQTTILHLRSIRHYGGLNPADVSIINMLIERLQSHDRDQAVLQTSTGGM